MDRTNTRRPDAPEAGFSRVSLGRPVRHHGAGIGAGSDGLAVTAAVLAPLACVAARGEAFAGLLHVAAALAGLALYLALHREYALDSGRLDPALVRATKSRGLDRAGATGR